MTTPAYQRSAVRGRVSVDPLLRLLSIGVPAVMLIGALTWPLYLSTSSFLGSWLLHLWFMWKQSMTIRAGHSPSLFLNYPRGVFYPQYAFYGGTLYTLTGVLSVVLGNAPVAAYVLTYLLAFAAAYIGWYWLARQAGLGHWQSQVPGLVFITSSYYLTLIYADGDWAEFVAVSTIPLMLSAGLSILRADRLHLGPALALTISGIFFFGSHSLTLVWGSTTIAVVGLAILICVPQARRQVSRKGLSRVAGLAVPALLVNAWFLVPAAANESTTWIASVFRGWQELLRESMYLVSTQHLFTLSRATATIPNTRFALSLPILAMAWALVGVFLAVRTGLRGSWTRILLICASFTALMIVLMTHAGLMLMLPHYYATLQYPYRLECYVLLGVSGTVLSVLVLARGKVRSLSILTRWALPPILVVAIVGAIQQAAAYPPTADREAAVASWSQEETSLYEAKSAAEASSSQGVFKDYIDIHQPIPNGSFEHPNGSLDHIGIVDFDNTAAQGTRISARTQLPPGKLADSNLFGSPDFVHVTGAKIVGINAGNGSDLLEIAPTSSSSTRNTPGTTRVISVATANSLPIVLGRVLTLCAGLALILQFGLLSIRRIKHAH
jgi:hypothetical protein